MKIIGPPSFILFPLFCSLLKKAYPPERRKQLAKQHTHDEKWQGPMGGRDRERSRSGSSQQKFILGLKQIACLPKSPRSWRQVRKEAVKKEEEGPEEEEVDSEQEGNSCMGMRLSFL